MITISPGHWINTGSGADGVINEVTEARRVANRVIQILRGNKIIVNHVEDNTSKTQQQNLSYLVSQHNKTNRKLDVSVHFNASTPSDKPLGVEVLYYDELTLSKQMSANIAKAGGFKDRGAKKRSELAFLANTNKPAVLLEICFVSSQEDVRLYKLNFEKICQSIANDLAEYVGETIDKLNGTGKTDYSSKMGYAINVDSKAFRIHTGAFKTKEDADKAQVEFVKKGYLKYAEVFGNKEHGYRLQSGKYVTQKEAENASVNMLENKAIDYASIIGTKD